MSEKIKVVDGRVLISLNGTCGFVTERDSDIILLEYASSACSFIPRAKEGIIYLNSNKGQELFSKLKELNGE